RQTAAGLPRKGASVKASMSQRRGMGARASKGGARRNRIHLGVMTGRFGFADSPKLGQLAQAAVVLSRMKAAGGEGASGRRRGRPRRLTGEDDPGALAHRVGLG